jgi:Fibronectin type III domain
VHLPARLRSRFGAQARQRTASAGELGVLLFAIFLSGCGYIGDPLPPLANIPARITDLAAIQRGSRIIVHFTPPEQTTEGRAIKTPLTLDLRIGTAVTPFSAAAWAAGARRIPAPPVKNGRAETEIPSTEWTGRDVTLAVRSIAANHKDSAWSDFVNLTVVPPPARPGSPKAENTAEGVRLTWQGDGGDFVVLRRAGDEKDFTQVAEVPQPEWLDRSTQFGKTYTYLVQRIVKPGGNRTAESELSEEVSIAPKDIFPPAAPTGLRVVSAPRSIELTWNRNTEPDLAGYRIYRALAGGAFEKIADTSQVPAYSDSKIAAGKSYRYEIAAVDQAGNESPRSAPAEAAAQ